jgi:NAD+ synthase
MTELPPIDPEKAVPGIVDFIRRRLLASGRHRLVVGLSGGIDSATSAYLAVRAVGPENLKAYLLPYRTTDRKNIEDALLVVDRLGIESRTVDITPVVDAYFREFPDADRKRRGNFTARVRMAVLYDQSEAEEALVLGTGNRTEALLGYTTLWGDMACAFTPLGGLYKTQVRRLASFLGVPEEIIEKPPTADLWEGQTDEGELGITYEEADSLLYHMVDLEYDNASLKKAGFDLEKVKKVRRMMAASAFKRTMPPHPRL